MTFSLIQSKLSQVRTVYLFELTTPLVVGSKRTVHPSQNRHEQARSLEHIRRRRNEKLPNQVSVTCEGCASLSNKRENIFIDTLTTLFCSHQLLHPCFSVIYSKSIVLPSPPHPVSLEESVGFAFHIAEVESHKCRSQTKGSSLHWLRIVSLYAHFASLTVILRVHLLQNFWYVFG